MPRLYPSICLALAALAAIAIAPPGAAGAQGLTIGEAIDRARRSSARVAGAQAVVRRARAASDTIGALRWPKISAAGVALGTGISVHADVTDPLRDFATRIQVPPQIIAGLPDIVFRASDERFFGRAQLQATLPLYTGGRVGAGRRNALLEVADARALARAVADSVMVELVDRYYGLRLARQASEVGRMAVGVLDRVRRDSELARRYGLLPARDTVPSDVLRAEAAQRRNQAARQVDLATYGLAATMGVAADTVALSPSSPFFIVTDLAPVDSFLAAAERGFPALERLRAGSERGRAGVDAARGSYLPQIIAFGMQQLYQSDLAPGLGIDVSWAVGVLASWTIFDGPGRGGRIEAARAQQQEVEWRLEQAARDVGLLVRQQYQELQNARDRADAGAAALASARRGARAERQRLAQGFSTDTRVAERELLVATARVARLQSLYEYVQALARLLAASGQADQFAVYAARGVDQEVDQEGGAER